MTFFLFCTINIFSNPLLQYDKLEEFMDAASYGNLEEVKYHLSEGASVHDRDPQGYTALMFAAFSGHTDIVKFLIDAGADVNKRNYNFGTALIGAAYAEHGDVIRMLVENGADIDAVGYMNLSALMTCARYGLTKTLKLLIDLGADINANKYGLTALSYAAMFNHIDAVRVLLNAGAKTDLRDSNGNTAADLAREKGYDDIAELIEISGK